MLYNFQQLSSLLESLYRVYQKKVLSRNVAVLLLRDAGVTNVSSFV